MKSIESCTTDLVFFFHDPSNKLISDLIILTNDCWGNIRVIFSLIAKQKLSDKIIRSTDYLLLYISIISYSLIMFFFSAV